MNAKIQLIRPDGTSLKIVPEPTLRRLPLYHRFLKEWLTSGRETVSCTDIGLDLDLDPTQVRKDLESVGVVGRPRIGYALTNVIAEVERFLGWNNINDAFLVEAAIYKILYRRFRGRSYYVDVLELFHEVRVCLYR